MPGDYSRRSFVPGRGYTAVQMQQGRVLTDADFNEQIEIGQHRTETEAIDVIGRCGAPRADAGFKIQLSEDGADLLISDGRLYAGGLLCENDPSAVPLLFPPGLSATQGRVASLTLNRRQLEPGHWVEISARDRAAKVFQIVAVGNLATLTFDADVSTYRTAVEPVLRRVVSYLTQPFYPEPDFRGTPTSPPGFEDVNLASGYYLAYLDTWQREITALDDPHIKEVALGGPDTTTRLMNVWQVRLLKVTPTGQSTPHCDDAFGEWAARTVAPTGLLTARTSPPDSSSGPCVLPPSAGFRSLENQLYRIEVHRGGPRATATFKVSRENASVQTRITVDGDTITADDLGKDDKLGFAGGQWVEVVDEISALNGPTDPVTGLKIPYDLFQIKAPTLATREITTDASISQFSGASGLQLRRWDQSTASATAAGVPMTSGWIDIEDGVQVRFSEGTYRSGDYWLIPARTATGDVEWAPFEQPATNPLPLPPVGIAHHYCRLALLRVNSAGIISIVGDCRDVFPPLTDIRAEDVSFDNTECKDHLPGVTTVQEAIEQLCHGGLGACTIHVSPEDNLQAAINRLPDKASARICFSVGEYVLPGPVFLNGLGDISLEGAGPGSHIVCPQSEYVFRFNNCKSVAVRDLAVDAGVAAGKEKQFSGLNGALTFVGCVSVIVEQVSVACAAGTRRNATCITVQDARASSLPMSSARIRGCRLSVGDLQTGILLINVNRAHVEDNLLFAPPVHQKIGLSKLLTDHVFRAKLEARMVSNTVLGTTPPPGGVTNAKIEFGGHTVLFQTHPALKSEWPKLLAAQPPQGVTTAEGLRQYLVTKANAILTNDVLRAQLPGFAAWFNAIRYLDTAWQGIVVAGETVSDVRVINNTVQNAMQAVHIGVSSRTPGGSSPEVLQIERVQVSGNSAVLRLNADSLARERHGIFVGNARSVAIHDNAISVQRSDGAEKVTITGAIVYGYLGRAVVVRHNHFTQFTTGVNVTPRYQLGNTPYPPRTSVLWLVADNMFENVTTGVVLGRTPTGAVAPVDVVGNKQIV